MLDDKRKVMTDVPLLNDREVLSELGDERDLARRKRTERRSKRVQG